MKKTAIRVAALLLCICVCAVSAYGAEYLIPVGKVIGLSVSDGTVTVAAFDDALGTKAKAAGLCAGDTIVSIDGKPISCAEDVRRALSQSGGTVTLQLQRKGKNQTIKLTPEITTEGPKLGVFLKEGITGIGTVTFYDPDTGNFGALGHGVNTADGSILRLSSGKAYAANIASVCKGKAGQPGQLRGALCGTEPIAELTRNTNQGIFGKTDTPWTGHAMEVAACAEIQTGPATILSTILGETVQEYSVEILKIYPKTKSGDKNMLLRVTDPDLLKTTGGIVQGMGVSYNRDNTGNPNSLRGFQVTDP